MSTDNVTPIRASAPKQRTPRKYSKFHLAQPDGEPDNMRLIQALHGVCYAIENLSEGSAVDVPLELGTAAEILSEMLQDRLNPPD